MQYGAFLSLLHAALWACPPSRWSGAGGDTAPYHPIVMPVVVEGALIAGHIGFTLGAATLMQQLRKRPALLDSQLALLAVVALLPDILDRSIHFAYARYPEHLLFHSLPLYALAIAGMWKFHRKTAFILMVMAFNVSLDFVNNSPEALLFPIGELGFQLPAQSLAAALTPRLPHWLTITWAGHCVVFELTGAVLGTWAMWRAGRETIDIRP